MADEVNKTITSSIGGINVLMGEIQKMVNVMEKLGFKIGDFFLSWEKYVNKYINGMKFLEDTKNWTAMLYTITIPVFGQLYARFALLNGSMNKPWLFLFSMPPLTIIPALAIMFSMVDKIEGEGDPWDNIVWFPLIGNTIGAIFARNHPSRNIFKFFLSIGGFFIAYWYRSTKGCNAEGSAKSSKLALDALISYIATICLVLFLPYIPYIGSVFSILQDIIPYSEIFFQAFAIFLVYVITNIANAEVPRRARCNTDINTNILYTIILIALILTALISVSPDELMAQAQSMAMAAKQES